MFLFYRRESRVTSSHKQQLVQHGVSNTSSIGVCTGLASALSECCKKCSFDEFDDLYVLLFGCVIKRDKAIWCFIESLTSSFSIDFYPCSLDLFYYIFVAFECAASFPIVYRSTLSFLHWNGGQMSTDISTFLRRNLVCRNAAHVDFEYVRSE